MADFAHVATWSGIVYAASVVDVFSRAGWSAATSKRAKLVLDALDMALWRRDRAGTPAGPGLVHHSDTGSQLGFKGSLLGLADAHRVGVVHRDYKPDNVLVVPDGSSKLVNFGIAVDAGISVGVAGTPCYMAPEQWTGAPASPAADVYAATTTFFECLTGHRPYAGDNLAELALQHVDAAPAPKNFSRRSVASSSRSLLVSPSRWPASTSACFTQSRTAVSVRSKSLAI